MLDEFFMMTRTNRFYEDEDDDLFDGKAEGDVSPVEAERMSAIGRKSTLWEDSV